MLAHGSGRQWDDKEPRAEITTVDGIKWQDRKDLPSSGSLEILVLRLPIFVGSDQKPARPPAATNAGASPSPPRADEAETKKDEEGKPKYRVGGSELSGTYTISREEVAHFIAETAVKNWDQYKGKAVIVSR